VSAVEWGAALAMGFMGSTHCVAMCGPLSNVLGSVGARAPDARGASRTALVAVRRLPIVATTDASSWRSRLTLQAGRITTYGGLGALAGFAGSGIRRLPALPAIQLGVRIGAALLLVGVGLYVAGVFRQFSAVERGLSPLRRVLNAALRRARGHGLLGTYATGVAWGLLPCGLVMGGLALAILTASPLGGLLVMMFFGIGTIPALLAVDVFAVAFQRVVRQAWLKRAGGALIIVSGIVQATLALEQARAMERHEAPCPCCSAHAHGPT